ncbi:MAG: thermonuclease family protein [Planctomycetota bacterium]
MFSFRIAVILLVLVAFTGCEYYEDELGQEKLIPYPVNQKVPFQMKCELFRVWSSNQIQIRSAIHTTFVSLRGVKTFGKDREAEFFARDQLHQWLDSKPMDILVFNVNQLRHTSGDIMCEGRNINLEVVRAGWGRYDGSKFDDWEKFAEAEETAKTNGRGLWGNEF